jgi:hypothetical protein
MMEEHISCARRYCVEFLEVYEIVYFLNFLDIDDFIGFFFSKSSLRSEPGHELFGVGVQLDGVITEGDQTFNVDTLLLHD